ncbi:MAG: HAMP domain-containing sensor histidine kinase [Caldilineaceae bacterium]
MSELTQKTIVVDNRRSWLLALRFVAGVVMVVLVALALFFAIMNPPMGDLRAMALFLSITALISIVTGYAFYRSGWIYRSPRLSWTLLGGYALSSLLTFLNVFVTARLMFASEHDLLLATVLLAFAAGIAMVLGYFLSSAVTDKIGSLTLAANTIAQGDLSVRVTTQGTDEVSQLAHTFNEMVARLEEADRKQREVDRLRRDLIAWVGHDLRTPLASMRAILEALGDGLVTDPETVQRYLVTAQRDIQSLSTLIDDLFEMAQIDAGGLQLEKRANSIVDLISDTLEGFSALAQERGVFLSGQAASGVDPVRMDAQQIGRVLTNLVGNAVRHTPRAVTSKCRHPCRAPIPSWLKCATAARASLPRAYRASSSNSTAPNNHAAAPPAAPVLASPSPRASSKPTAAKSVWRACRGEDLVSSLHCRGGRDQGLGIGLSVLSLLLRAANQADPNCGTTYSTQSLIPSPQSPILHSRRQYPRTLNNLRHGLLLPVGHDVDAVDAFDLPDLLDDFHADLDAFFAFAGFGRLGQAFDHGVGDVDAGDFAAHEFGCPLRAQWTHAHEDEDLFVQPQIAHVTHVRLQHRHVETVLRLDEIGAGRDLLGQPQVTELTWRRKRVGGGAEEESGRRGQLAPAEEDAVFAHRARRLEQLDRIEVEDAPRLGLIPGADVVTCEAEDILHAHRRRAQQITLHGDAVAVATAHLEHRFVAGAGEQRTATQTAHVTVGAGAIGGVDRVAHLGEDKGILVHVLGIGAIRCVQFGGHREPS